MLWAAEKIHKNQNTEKRGLKQFLKIKMNPKVGTPFLHNNFKNEQTTASQKQIVEEYAKNETKLFETVN